MSPGPLRVIVQKSHIRGSFIYNIRWKMISSINCMDVLWGGGRRWFWRSGFIMWFQIV